MRREGAGPIWMAAALPPELMLLLLVCSYLLEWWGNRSLLSWAGKIAPAVCALLLAASVVTGVWVLFRVFVGWRRGTYRLPRSDVLAATLLATLDIVLPLLLILLVWLLARAFRDSSLIFL